MQVRAVHAFQLLCARDDDGDVARCGKRRGFGCQRHDDAGRRDHAEAELRAVQEINRRVIGGVFNAHGAAFACARAHRVARDACASEGLLRNFERNFERNF